MAVDLRANDTDQYTMASSSNLGVGSRVQLKTSFQSDKKIYGIIRWIGILPMMTGKIAGIELEEDKEGCSDGTFGGEKYFNCPHKRGFYCLLTNVVRDERYRADESTQVPPFDNSLQPVPKEEPMYQFIHIQMGVGSTVQINTADTSRPPYYGVIRWIGTVAGVQGQITGIELEELMDGCTDGTFQSTGEKFFQCQPGRGLYYPLVNLRPDQRFVERPGTALNEEPDQRNPLQVPLVELKDQFIHDSSQQMMKYIGNQKGVQGHQNSCYLDSTVFGLFALSDVFDTMFLEADVQVTSHWIRKTISNLLWKGLVNPLRKNGVVRYESVMMLRKKLEELGKMEGITEKEKDPEEFLNMLFKHMLHTTPFISIRRPFGTEQEFFVQLFVEYDENVRLPTVGDLLRKMFTEQNISFTKVPARFLIQVPRFGREFKTYQKIVPDLKLCIAEQAYSYDEYIKGHANPMKVDPVDVGDVSELDLLSVICIETSHYVCFTRDPRDDQENKWIFFDSMADRQYHTYNIPKVTDCTRDLNEWVYPANGDRTRLMSTQPRQLPELVRRFTQDVYMCVYVQPDIAMYMYGDDYEDFGECSTLAKRTGNVSVPPIASYVGNEKGIQGHQNSCYLDCTVFGLFALSDIFDSVLTSTQTYTDPNRKVVSDLLWKGIIIPLRKNGAVRYEPVMKLRNKLDELEKMGGITESEKDPEEFLNMLFKHVLHTSPFISIRRPFGVEEEFFVQLFVEYDESLRPPAVGKLLKKMFQEQQISFTKMPSKVLIQVPRFGREFKTYQKIVPDLNLDIAEITDSYNSAAVPECVVCGERASLKCADCKGGFHSQHDTVHFCTVCSARVHTKKDKNWHKSQHVVHYTLDLLSVICIETSHHICFTRDPRDDQENKWIFFDSMADRIHDTYNIPKVTDCTRDLNEWVYPANGDRTRLMSTEPRQLPEFVRRFTQDVYMCVYVQPESGNPRLCDKTVHTGSTVQVTLPAQPPQATYENSSAVFETERAKQENARLLQTQATLLQEISALNHEKKLGAIQNRETIQLLQQEKRQLQHDKEQQQQMIDRQRDMIQQSSQQLSLEKQEKQQIQQHNQQLEHEKQQLQHQVDQLRVQMQVLQQRLDTSVTPSDESRFTKVQIPLQAEDSWNVRRQEVVIKKELGHGAWGSVCKGTFRGQTVAVKRAHKEILYDNTIDQLNREIRIMVHVQHPNLVRLIAAVVDRKVELRTDSPLLVLELLDTNLRSAYKEKNLKANNLVSIFRDVAYALHYLHEHQEPIIHRDVSAPNVLLEEVHPDVWRAKLSDFGSANLVKHCKTAAAGAIIYSAPETFPPRNPNDPLPKQTTKIDVFSYGYLLAEVIAKEMPSADKRREMLAKIQRQWKPVYELILACVEFEPEKRLTMNSLCVYVK